jgi:hypothetical protein
LNTVNESLTVAEWRVTVEYAETPWPSQALQGGASWTYSDLVDQGGTYATLAATWSTYFVLAVGPVDV